ncbi:amidohydrolase family protein [Kitasatospora acidiphila]|uniref:Amidohydrolase family protein n=1 Tax=Kitasatospora acidiphila TaxID=2567942 RepID=A0A540VYC0_9ACTN|nr:amidohydrolase family protein [Kitasatospora acidiphila]TQF01768.1 amidohydrolase family protein [Kitasatospora acidiphila]
MNTEEPDVTEVNSVAASESWPASEPRPGSGSWSGSASWPGSQSWSEPEPESWSGPVALIGARLIDGTGAAACPATDLLIEGGRIIRLGPTGSVGIPPHARLVPCDGLSVLPGFIDSHTHVERDIPAVLHGFLQDGVTSIGNTGSGPQLIEELHRAGRQPGAANVFVAGPAITAPGGYPVIRGDGSAARPVHTADEARAAVDELAARGVDFIKVTQESFDFNYRSPGRLPVLPPALIQAAARRAHEHGLPVRSHVHHVDQLDAALAAAVDSIEHLLFPLPPETGYVELQRAGRLRLDALPDFARWIDRMVAAGVRLVPTLGSELTSIRIGLPELPDATLTEIEQLLVEVVRRFTAAGGRIALGSDWVGLPGIPAGRPRQELHRLLAAGLTPLQVIEAATQGAAAVCGRAGRLGVLAPGLPADLLLVDGDPSADLAALDALRVVLKDGRVVAGRLPVAPATALPS